MIFSENSLNISNYKIDIPKGIGINEKLYYLDLIKLKLKEDGFYFISFVPKLERLNNYGEKEVIFLEKEMLYIRNREENIWRPLSLMGNTKFCGYGIKQETIFIDLKIENSATLLPGNYFLYLSLEMENLIIYREEKDFLKKENPQLEKKRIKIEKDFPYFQNISQFNGRGGIIGNVFYDENGDGIRQKNEKGIPAIKIKLSNGREVYTDENGKFSFCGLLPQNYSIFYTYSGKIFYFGTIDLKSFMAANIEIPLSKIEEEGYYTDHFSIQFESFFGKDGFFGKSFHLSSSYFFDIDYNSKEKDIRKFFKEGLSYYSNSPIYADESKEYENSRLKRKFSLSFEEPDKSLKINYGFMRGFFANSYFLRYNYTSEGLNFSYRKNKFSISLYAQRLIGEKITEYIKPNDTIGPFYLSYKPILFLTENLIMEIRDRKNEKRLIAEINLQRNKDYYIDYKSGIIGFYYPIPSTTFEGNPIIIRVTYQMEIEKINFKDFSYGLELSYNNQAVRYLEVKSKPENERFLEFFGKFGRFEYSIAYEKIKYTKKAIRLDYKGEKFRAYLQNIDENFENPSGFPVGDGFKEIGLSFEKLRKKFGFSIGETKKNLFYSYLFLEWFFKDYKIQNSIQYFEEKKEIFLGSSFLKENCEVHLSKSFKDYFFSYIFKKEKFNLNLKIDKFKDYTSIRFGANIKNFNFNFSKDLKKSGLETYEFSYITESEGKRYLMSSVKYEDGLYKLYVNGRSDFQLFEHFYIFLDGRAFSSKNGEGNIFLNSIFGFRPLYNHNFFLFLHGILKEDFNDLNKKEYEYVYGINYKYNKSNLYIQGKKNSNIFYFNSSFEHNIYKKTSFFINMNYLKENNIKKNFGFGISFKIEEQKFLIGYNNRDFPDYFYQEKFTTKKGFYFGFVLPIVHFKTYKLKKEEKLSKIEARGDLIKSLGEELEIKLKTLNEEGKIIPYSGRIYIKGINDKGSNFEKKLKFKSKDEGYKNFSIIFSKNEDEGSWILYFYDMKDSKEKGRFLFYISSSKAEKLLSFEEPEVYLTKEKEGICIPSIFQVNTPEFANVNEYFNLTIVALSKEKEICKDYTGEVFLYLSDGTRLAEEPFSFSKIDYGIKNIKIKIEKKGDFMVIVNDKKNINLMGISDIINIRE